MPCLPSPCLDFTDASGAKLLIVAALDLGACELCCFLLSALPALSLPLSACCLSPSVASLLLAGCLSPSESFVKGLRSAAALIAAGLGSLTSSVVFSWTVASVDFPLAPLDGPFAGVCSCAGFVDSSLACLDVGGGVLFCGVALCTLIEGGLATSTLFKVDDDPLLELGPDGGGDLRRGETGHCGVLSPLVLELFPALGALPASPFAPPGSAGTFAADRARCIAAAEGCVAMGVVTGCGLLSLRMGEVLREVSGLEPAEGV